ncbi:unnamed protein product [Arabis nemorensis]|uniref:Uncharacterized protein n=1 Tax=Arabis nemorensis TaxID=586526 RepID=A0A565C6W2_9BRAS|nr:unnamed protein product [Arabis nemorensis]
MKAMDNQIAQVASSSKSPTNALPGKSETNPKSFCNVAVLGKEKVLGVNQRCLELSQQEQNEQDVEEFAMLLGYNEEAAFVMVLSKRWRNLFTIIPKLHFDGDEASFEDFVDGVYVGFTSQSSYKEILSKVEPFPNMIISTVVSAMC